MSVIIHRFFNNRSIVDMQTTGLRKIDRHLFFRRTFAGVDIDVVVDIDG